MEGAVDGWAARLRQSGARRQRMAQGAAAPAGKAQAKQGLAAEDGSGRRRLWRALGVGGAQLWPVARRDRGAGGAGELKRHRGRGGNLKYRVNENWLGGGGGGAF